MAGLMDYLTSLIPGPTAPPGGYAPTENVFGGTRPMGFGLPVPAGPPRGGQGGSVSAPAVRPTPNPNSPIMNSVVAVPPPVPAGAVGRLRGAGMPAIAAPVATPIARDATGDATAVPAAGVSQEYQPIIGRQLPSAPGSLAPSEGLPPVAVASPPMTGRQVTENLLSNPHLPPSIRIGLMGGLPRQPMPAEIAQQKSMQMATDQLQYETSPAGVAAIAKQQGITVEQAHQNAMQRFNNVMKQIGGTGMVQTEAAAPDTAPTHYGMLEQ